jgi:hypothetical protein
MTRLAQTIISLVERKALTTKVVRPELVCEMIARSLVPHYQIYWSLPTGSKLTAAVCVGAAIQQRLAHIGGPFLSRSEALVALTGPGENATLPRTGR